MIKTKQIKSISQKLPFDTDNEIYVNVLTWHNENHIHGSKYYTMSPYYLKTDGLEEQVNPGNVLFENFWQGSKVWPTVFDIAVYAHPNWINNPKHLWFEYKCDNNLGYENHLNSSLNQVTPKYFEWRNKVWSCVKPIRYPNGRSRIQETAFALLVDKDDKQTKLNYLEARERLYIKEYCRLVKNLDEYKKLLDLYTKENKTIIICEIDVPDDTILNANVLNSLRKNVSKPFGHGLCLGLALLGLE